jgi:hypothetical protein
MDGAQEVESIVRRKPCLQKCTHARVDASPLVNPINRASSHEAGSCEPLVGRTGMEPVCNEAHGAAEVVKS